MPSPAHVSIVKIRKWFPSTDPLAAKIARLCILREDLLLEMQGMIENVDELFKRVYFFRNLLRTYMELSSAIQRLLGDAEFKALLDRQPDAIKAKFSEGEKGIAKGHSILKDVRNAIGGHVREKSVQEALERIELNNPEAFGLLDIGPKQYLSHYKFAGEITDEILLEGVSEEERRNIESSKFAAIAELLPLSVLIQDCFVIYAQDRGFIKLRS